MVFIGLSSSKLIILRNCHRTHILRRLLGTAIILQSENVIFLVVPVLLLKKGSLSKSFELILPHVHKGTLLS